MEKLKISKIMLILLNQFCKLIIIYLDPLQFFYPIFSLSHLVEYMGYK